MPPRPRLAFLPFLLLALPAALSAQQPDLRALRADSALATCLALNERHGSGAAEAALTAEFVWRSEVSRRPADPAAHVGLARALIQCRLDAGGMADQAALFEETLGELQRAIALDPRYWPARFTLGLVLAGAPSFLGQSANAITELERATAPDGIPPGRPELADAMARLVGLYHQAGRDADAAPLRERGAALYPEDPRFGGTPRPAPAPVPARSSGPASPEASRPAADLGELTVTAAAPEAEGRRSGRSLSAIDIVTTPGGTADLQQALQTLPGVTGGSESSDLVLRGGDPEESPLYLNGARLAYAGKFESLNGGLFGVIDPSVLRTARVLAGGFSARYGDALSGVIESEAMGQPGGPTWRSGLNTAGVSGTVAGPLGDGYGGWASFRATHTGLLLRLQDRRSDFSEVPISLEGIGSAIRTVANGEIQGIALVEHDAASPYITAGGYQGAYSATGTTVSGIVSGRLFAVGPFASLRFNTAVSSRRTRLGFGALDRSRDLRRLGARVEGDWIAGGSVIIHSGLEVARVSERLDGTIPAEGDYTPGAATRTLRGPARGTAHLGAFAEATITATPWLSFTAGGRLDRLPGEKAASVDPRLALAVQSGPWSLTAGAGVFRQGRFRPTPDQPGSDTRTGVPRRADHLLLGLERRGRATVRADLYLKRYGGWVEGDSGFTPTAGRIVGADLFINLAGASRSGRITYSVMRGRLTLPGGTSVSSAYDVTHSVVAILNQRFGRDWELGGTARLSTGRPFTAAVGLAEPDPATGAAAPLLGQPNGDRYPTYARLDARLSRYARMGTGLLVIFGEVLNLTNRGNVAAYGYDAGFTRRTPVRTFFGRRTVILGAELRY